MSFYSISGKDIAFKTDDQIIHAVESYFDSSEYHRNTTHAFRLGVEVVVEGKGKISKHIRFQEIEYKANKRIKNFDAGIYAFVQTRGYSPGNRHRGYSYSGLISVDDIFGRIPASYVACVLLFKESKNRFFMVGAELDDNTAMALVRTWKAFEDLPMNYGLFDHYTLAVF